MSAVEGERAGAGGALRKAVWGRCGWGKDRARRDKLVQSWTMTKAKLGGFTTNCPHAGHGRGGWPNELRMGENQEASRYD